MAVMIAEAPTITPQGLQRIEQHAPGYNLFALGQTGAGKHAVMRKFLEEQASPFDALMAKTGVSSALGRYHVNVLDDHEAGRGAPVIYEDKPTFQNLIGRIEHVAQMGTLVTDFTHIKAGALHKANGGYLILDARQHSES
jgi:predicted ATP-dependent protease